MCAPAIVPLARARHPMGGLRRRGAHKWTFGRLKATAALLLRAVSQRRDHERERRRRLTTARILEVIAGKRRRPVGENANEPTFLNIHINQVFRQMRKPETCKRGLTHECDGIECHLPSNADFEFSAALPKIPDIETAVRGEAQVDAGVVG